LLTEPESRLAAAVKADSAASVEAAKTAGIAASARAAAEQATAALGAAREQAASGQQLADLLASATEKLQQAASVGGDQEIAAAVAALSAQSQKRAGALGGLAQAVSEKEQAAKTASEQMSAAQQAQEAAAASALAARQTLAAIDAEAAPLKKNWQDRATAAAVASSRLKQGQLLAQFAAATDDGTRAALDQQLADDWSQRFAVSPLSALSPEQLAWSMMQVAGLIERERAAAAAEWEKSNPLPADAPAGAAGDAARVAAREAHVEKAAYEKLQANAGVFVNLFAGAAGQPQDDFFATVDQALFLANGGHVRSWLAPGGGNLTERLTSISDPQEFADELYLSVLCRPPTPAEVEEASAYLAPRSADRAAAIQEVVWALLTSVEFRFSS
jgi:hypothetical protein